MKAQRLLVDRDGVIHITVPGHLPQYQGSWFIVCHGCYVSHYLDEGREDPTSPPTCLYCVAQA